MVLLTTFKIPSKREKQNETEDLYIQSGNKHDKRANIKNKSMYNLYTQNKHEKMTD